MKLYTDILHLEEDTVKELILKGLATEGVYGILPTQISFVIEQEKVGKRVESSLKGIDLKNALVTILKNDSKDIKESEVNGYVKNLVNR